MEHGRRISVIGLGYVGLPVAVAFGLKNHVIGYFRVFWAEFKNKPSKP